MAYFSYHNFTVYKFFTFWHILVIPVWMSASFSLSKVGTPAFLFRKYILRTFLFNSFLSLMEIKILSVLIIMHFLGTCHSSESKKTFIWQSVISEIGLRVIETFLPLANVLSIAQHEFADVERLFNRLESCERYFYFVDFIRLLPGCY